MRPRVLILGDVDRGDDGAVVAIASELPRATGTVVLVGQGDLLDHLEPDVPTVLVDTVRAGQAPGTVSSWTLPEVLAGTRIGPHASTHTLSVGPALRLWMALGGRLPPGGFVGIEGEDYTRGAPISDAVRANLPALRDAVVEMAKRYGK